MPQPLSCAFHQRSVTSKSGRPVASSQGRFGYATSAARSSREMTSTCSSTRRPTARRARYSPPEREDHRAARSPSPGDERLPVAGRRVEGCWAAWNSLVPVANIFRSPRGGGSHRHRDVGRELGSATGTLRGRPVVQPHKQYCPGPGARRSAGRRAARRARARDRVEEEIRVERVRHELHLRRRPIARGARRLEQVVAREQVRDLRPRVVRSASVSVHM